MKVVIFTRPKIDGTFQPLGDHGRFRHILVHLAAFSLVRLLTVAQVFLHDVVFVFVGRLAEGVGFGFDFCRRTDEETLILIVVVMVGMFYKRGVTMVRLLSDVFRFVIIVRGVFGFFPNAVV